MKNREILNEERGEAVVKKKYVSPDMEIDYLEENLILTASGPSTEEDGRGDVDISDSDWN